MRVSVFAVLALAAGPFAADAQVPGPIIAFVNPNSASAGSPDISISITGTNFTSSSIVYWNLSTRLLSNLFVPNQLTAIVPASLLTTSGTATILVENPDGSRSAPVVFTITGAGLTIITSSLPDGTLNTPYVATLTASGGTPPYTWFLSSGSLPPGLVLSGAGTITGTPTLAGIFAIGVGLRDATQANTVRSFSLRVSGVAFSIITSSSLPPGTVGAPYSQRIFAEGGQPPYRWAIATAAPPGLTIDATNGTISGTPSAAGSYTFTVQATDTSSAIASKVFNLPVNPGPLNITTGTLFTGTVGQPYTQTFAASGGVPPYRWALASGQFPPGLNLDSNTGTLSGTPLTAGSSSFEIRVTDSLNATVSRSYTLTVEVPRLNILTSTPLPTGTAGTPYSVPFTAIGGAPPYSWAITSGSVPGIDLDSASGVFSGTPTGPGTFAFTVAVRDTAAMITSKAFSVVINPSALAITSPRQLPPATLGASYMQRIEATGGFPPYTWMENGLPAGLTMDPSTGEIRGTVRVSGTISFTARVTDNARATVVDLFRIPVNAPPFPDIIINGFPPISEPAQQQTISMALASEFPVALSGQLMLTFTPESGGGDSSIQFSTGGRTVSFTIDAGSTNFVFPVPSLAIQTGTVAGTIRLTVQYLVGDVDVTPNPVPSFTTRIERSAPRINSVRFTRSSSGMTVEVIGYATSREVTEAVFRFVAAPGNTLQTNEVRLPVESMFNTWFQGTSSSQFGSQFSFTQQFNVQGDPNAINLESVTLTNRLGSATGRP